MIQLYKKYNVDYSKNGEYVLFPTYCEVEREINGSWELTMEHPIDELERYKLLECEDVLKVPMPEGDKLYRIYEVDGSAEECVTVHARPIFMDAADQVYFYDERVVNKNGQQALDQLMTDTPYTGRSNIAKGRNAYYVRKNLMEALTGEENSFVQRWGGEIVYDDFTVVINDKTGYDRGVTVEYKKNLAGLELIENYENIATRIVPVGFNGRMLHTPKKYVDSEKVYDYEKLYIKEVEFSHIKMKEDSNGSEEDGVIVCSSNLEFDNAIISACEKMFADGADAPSIEIVVNMIELSHTKEYAGFEKLEAVGLGDTIHVKYPKFDTDIKERVTKQTWDCINKRNVELYIGSTQKGFFHGLSSSMGLINGVIDASGNLMAEKIAGIINGMTTQLKYQRDVAQRLDVRAMMFEDTMEFLENGEPNPTFGAMAYGTQGLQISRKRTEDGQDWEWSTAMTADGMMAQYIITGLLADKYGNNWWDLEKGQFHMSSGSGTLVDGIPLSDYITRSTANLFSDAVTFSDNENLWSYSSKTDGMTDPTGGTGAVGFTPDENGVYLVEGVGNRVFDRPAMYSYSVKISPPRRGTIKVTICGEVYEIKGADKAQAMARYVTISGQKTISNEVASGSHFSIEYVNGSSVYPGKTVCVYDLQATRQDVLTHEEVFNALTKNGAIKGIYADGNQLYISFTYAKGGELKLGGKAYGDSKLSFYDASGHKIGYIDTTGLNFSQGSMTPFEVANGVATFKMNGATKDWQEIKFAKTGCDIGAFHIFTDGHIRLGTGSEWSDGTDRMDVYGAMLFKNLVTYYNVDSVGLLSDGSVVRNVSSSKRYKNHIRNLEYDDVKGILDITPCVFTFKAGYLAEDEPKNGKPVHGFYAEDVEENYGEGVIYKDGLVENWNERTMIPAMLRVIQEQERRIKDLERRMERYESN